MGFSLSRRVGEMAAFGVTMLAREVGPMTMLSSTVSTVFCTAHSDGT